MNTIKHAIVSASTCLAIASTCVAETQLIADMSAFETALLNGDDSSVVITDIRARFQGRGEPAFERAFDGFGEHNNTWDFFARLRYAQRADGENTALISVKTTIPLSDAFGFEVEAEVTEDTRELKLGPRFLIGEHISLRFGGGAITRNKNDSRHDDESEPLTYFKHDGYSGPGLFSVRWHLGAQQKFGDFESLDVNAFALFYPTARIAVGPSYTFKGTDTGITRVSGLQSKFQITPQGSYMGLLLARYDIDDADGLFSNPRNEESAFVKATFGTTF